MIRLLAWLLNLAKYLTALAGLVLSIIAYDDTNGVITGLVRAGLMGLVLFGFAALFESWRAKLLRRVPPRSWSPPRPPRKIKKKQRRYETPPTRAITTAEHVEFPEEELPMLVPVAFNPAVASASLSPHMRRFIERGNQAIHAPPEGNNTEPDQASDRGRFIPPRKDAEQS